MHSSYRPQSYSANLERASPGQDKAMLQRQYRAKEADALAKLKKLLRGISQGADTHQTRLETIVQATEMIEYLYRRNTMLQDFHELPRPEPGHGATAVNSHLGELPSLTRYSAGPLSYYAQCKSNTHRRAGSGVVTYSADAWNPPTMPGCPTSLNGVAMSGDRSFRH